MNDKLTTVKSDPGDCCAFCGFEFEPRSRVYSDASGKVWCSSTCAVGGPIDYHDYRISKKGRQWSYVHVDYDGFEDPRCGLGSSVPDCIEQIEEWERDPIWPKPDAWSGGFADNH